MLEATMKVEVRKLTEEDEILLTFPVMHQLRPHLEEKTYLAKIRNQEALYHFHLAAAFDEGRVAAVAGYRISESLSWGRFLYVDDLATDPALRSKGYGKTLMDWLVTEARAALCREFHLDSGVQRHEAHRFYLRERMDITCFHFAMKL